MRKPNIDKILLKGSPKQRMSIILEHIAADSYGRTSPITESEYRTLSDSFKSDYEIKLFNKMIEQERAIRYYLPNIQNMYHLYLSKINTLRGLCLLWNEYNREEEVFNLLIQEVKDEETKDQMREIIKDRGIIWGDVKTDKEGFIEIVTDKRQKRLKTNKNSRILNTTEEQGAPPSLQGAISLLSKDTEEYLGFVKTMIEVVREFMRNTTEIKTYRDMLKELEAPLFNDNSPLPIFKKDPTNKDNMSIYSKYQVFPEYSETEIDKEFFNEEYQAGFNGLEG